MPRSGRVVKLSSSHFAPSSFLIFGAIATARWIASFFSSSLISPAASAAYLTIICLLPEYLVSALSIPFYLGGTSLLIVVNVTMDTVTQIQSHLLAHQYGDLIKKAKLKGGRLR